MVALVSRTGRHLQRYNTHGSRQVVGCIPYRYKDTKQRMMPSLVNEEDLEVLVINAQKPQKGMLFPKGGWEMDESIKEAALRETLEEAGVRGIVESQLGKWSFKSKTHDGYYDGYMFPLLVEEELEFWPEKNIRRRIWISVAEARKVCQQSWMKEALEILVDRLVDRGIQGWIMAFLNPAKSLGISSEDELKFTTFAVVALEKIWSLRNRVVHQNEMVNIEQLSKSIATIAQEHVSARAIKAKEKAAIFKSPPPMGWIKDNFDVANGMEKTCMAAVFRNSEGIIVHAKTWSSFPLTPLQGEARAAWLTTVEAYDRGFKCFILEGDSLLVTRPLQNQELEPEWIIASLIADARLLLNFSFSSWSVKKVNRLANSMSHNLAKWASSCNLFGSFIVSDLPPLVNEVDRVCCPTLLSF